MKFNIVSIQSDPCRYSSVSQVHILKHIYFYGEPKAGKRMQCLQIINFRSLEFYLENLVPITYAEGLCSLQPI